MRFILETLLNAGVLLGIAYLWPAVKIKNYVFAIVVALILGVLNSTIGFLIRTPLNFLTLGMLTFIIRMIVSAFLLKVIDSFTDDLTIDGYLPAIVIAIAMALASSIL
ncbi:MAG: phage holin family protein [Emticicia sp.]|nr:phage holin family protein [Emticicia sp.]